ncbi:MAG: LPS assembly lipoprotein LptE [Elusimicrobiota bacterium]
MKKRFCALSGFLLMGLMSGCADNGYHRVPINIPENIRKIAIADFVDPTGHTTMTQKLVYEVKNAFVRDSRVGIGAVQDADALLQGAITRYIVEPVEFDEFYAPKVYQLWIWVDIAFVDLKTKDVVWVEKRLEVKLNYSINDISAGGLTSELEAQDAAAKILAENIMKRTIDGWGVVSGVSERL